MTRFDRLSVSDVICPKTRVLSVDWSEVAFSMGYPAALKVESVHKTWSNSGPRSQWLLRPQEIPLEQRAIFWGR